MSILEHFNKENLHHAYLIEGNEAEIIPEILEFLKNTGIQTINNPDFCHITVDSFKIDDARNLKSLTTEKSFATGKKIFLISINNILLEAQNTLLKIFEEPGDNTIFFLVIPNSDNLLKTLVSRFYLIKTKEKINLTEAEKFIKLPLNSRILFIKEFLTEENDDEENFKQDSAKTRALKFINALEIVLHKQGVSGSKVNCFEHLLKVREYLSQPGSSIKMLLESVAITITIFKNY